MGEQRWLTLRELAEARSISLHSAARLVRRHGWRKQADNQGHVRALVPAEALDRPGATPTDRPRAGPDRLGDLAAALDTMTTLMREQIERERGRADAAEAEVRRLTVIIDGFPAEREQLQAEAAELRHQVKAATQRATDAQQAREEADKLREAAATREGEDRAMRVSLEAAEARLRQLQEADAARRSKGRLARLLGAWTGE